MDSLHFIIVFSKIKIKRLHCYIERFWKWPIAKVLETFFNSQWGQSSFFFYIKKPSYESSTNKVTVATWHFVRRVRNITLKKQLITHMYNIKGAVLSVKSHSDTEEIIGRVKCPHDNKTLEPVEVCIRPGRVDHWETPNSGQLF